MAELQTRQRTVRRSKRVGGWREIVLARAALIHAQLDATRQDTAAWRSTEASAHAHLEAAITAASQRRGTGLRDWLTGAQIDAAWTNLHNAELVLVSVVSEEDLTAGRQAVVGLVEQTLTKGDPRCVEAREQLVEKWPAEGPGALQRAAYRAALQWGFVAADEQYARVRSLRNLILGSALFMLVLAVGMGVLGTLRPHLVSLCFDNVVAGGAERRSCPAGASGPGRWDILLVELLGLLGGSLSAMVAIRGMRGTSTPYGVPVALALLKLPAGALVSLSALLLLGGEFFPGLSGLDSPQQIVAYALVLGYAQQLVTRLVDRQANTVLDKVPSSEPAQREQPSAATSAQRTQTDSLAAATT
ncbi:hypothetical protein RB614_35605 [Phytohabitans sp. ZYX-F-186]|uniref:Uncharacterized protein n=1 Tax=Phytohabitans maris TaxID=3071409 RepID=A0ABU0ZS54_9ACTN|nr:hypothetical protein [Phytohabitans sp. ZYX-F-186]MDQ7909837.1 hypothetical protein [Phytohabitans sp. ZYX-F-186]